MCQQSFSKGDTLIRYTLYYPSTTHPPTDTYHFISHLPGELWLANDNDKQCSLYTGKFSEASYERSFNGHPMSLLHSGSNLWSPYVIGQTIYIFMLWFVLLFLSRLISAAADWMSTILPHMVWPQCEFKMQVWNLLHAACWKHRTQKKSPKIAIWAPSHNFVRLYLRN